MNHLNKIDRALDEALVNLGAIVLRLSDPAVTRTAQERRALALSVHQFAACADRSEDPRVHEMRGKLEATIRPNLRLVSSC